jgi:hypothetical protein
MMLADLTEDYFIEKLRVLRDNNSFDEIYNENEDLLGSETKCAAVLIR